MLVFLHGCAVTHPSTTATTPITTCPSVMSFKGASRVDKRSVLDNENARDWFYVVSNERAMSKNKNLLRLPFSSDQSNGNHRAVYEAASSNADDDSEPATSRVTFSNESVASVVVPEGDGEDVIDSFVPVREREGWDNKTQFLMGVVSYAVGLGNVWRFPYLCQKNGGGAFLIPYCIMMVLEGMPLFLIELGIGQRLRTGPVGVWNAIHPYLGGIGVSASIVSYLVGLYYNVIITWCIFYLYNSFTFGDLPWAVCPVDTNGTSVIECAKSSSPTTYYWNRVAINTSGSIGDMDNFVWHMTTCLLLAWTLIYLCVMKGIKSSGKVMYVTATFPYCVTTAFLIRSGTLPGAMDGLAYMMTPDLERLWDPEVWLDAATQIFYSMGLGFGGLIAFGSYNKIKNNVIQDTVMLSCINLATSFYTAIVVFCVIGFMAFQTYNECLTNDFQTLMSLYPDKFASIEALQNDISVSDYVYMMEHKFHLSEFPLMANHSAYCNYKDIIASSAQGTGLAFVVFTEAILQFPWPPVWAILFFLMLLMLGLGSMFGTLEGVITSLNDSHMIKVTKPVLTFVLCFSACIVGLVFTTGAGQYWVSMFDHFAGSYALMCVAFFEIIAVIYVYGYRRFCNDLEFMTGQRPSQYWIFTWRFISPTIMFVLLLASIIKSFVHLPVYSAYDAETTHQIDTPYPAWALFLALLLISIAMGPVPFIYFVRKFKIWKMEGDIPAASKCLGSTPSTTYMLKSEPSFNRMVESTASELQRTGMDTIDEERAVSSRRPAASASTSETAKPNGSSKVKNGTN
uniref:Transporter n=1 Tax=Panagrellus redivivus TaxID=6233 RepID=A0A7E4UQ34_PANRE